MRSLVRSDAARIDGPDGVRADRYTYGMSSGLGATFGARRRYLSMSLGFAVPATKSPTQVRPTLGLGNRGHGLVSNYFSTDLMSRFASEAIELTLSSLSRFPTRRPLAD